MTRSAIARISPDDLRRGSEAFERGEGRGSMYRVATFLLREWWGDYPKMADALSVLLLTWNWAFYRYGPFDQRRLERCLEHDWATIGAFHSREITSFDGQDHALLRNLFLRLLKALEISKGKKKGCKSPVAVAKALHLLAPAFLPPWDNAIAEAYGCSYSSNPDRAYLRFCEMMREEAVRLKSVGQSSVGKTLLKQIDEFNYAKYTKGWI